MLFNSKWENVNSKHCRIGFNSVSEFLEYIENTRQPLDREISGGSYDLNEWIDTPDNDATKLCTIEGSKMHSIAFERAEKEALALTRPTNGAEIRRNRMSVGGGCLSVPHYLAGSDKPFKLRRKVSTKPVLKILVTLGALGSVDSSTYMHRGVAILNALDQLELSGVSIELDCVHAAMVNGCRNGKSKSVFKETFIRLKEAGTPLDVQRFVFMFCSSSFHRRFMIRNSYGIWEAGVVDKGTTDSGRTAMAKTIDYYDVVIPNLSGSNLTYPQCKEIVSNAINDGID